MAVFRTFNQIVSSMLERLRLVQVDLDTKPGTVARDLFIDIQADELDKLYKTISAVSDKQSPDSAVGSDLIKWARNFGIEKSPGSPSNGIVVFTTDRIAIDIPIPSGTIVTARNGSTYTTIGNYVMSASEASKYAANASRLRSALSIAGISDQYAIEVPVRATRAGTTGNIGSLQIVTSNIQDSLRVTNLTSFNDGTNVQSDESFKSTVYAKFSGSNVGTSAGYRASALTTIGVLDALVVEPGNALMLRDGTSTIQLDDNSFKILSSGTGGKVDMYILGRRLEEVVQSFIYTDYSGSGDATDERNDLIPGISPEDYILTSLERRVKSIKTGSMPAQPVDSVVSLVGSSSGVLTERFVDSAGNVFGNFEIIKDTNASTGGSPFGFDKIRFISNEKSVDSESISKPSFNSIDPLRFSGVNSVEGVYQDIQVSKENSKVSAVDRKMIRLNHRPCVNVSRVVNTTTGEVYVIADQNLDENGLNTSGVVYISGKTYPTASDILSVDYTWRLFFDPFVDYNGGASLDMYKDYNAVDSIDWGVPNGVFIEETVINQTPDGFEYNIQVNSNVSRVNSVFAMTIANSVVSVVGGQTVVDLSLLDDPIENVYSIIVNGVDVYGDGNFLSRRIFLPSNAPVSVGDAAIVNYNKVELFNIESGNGSFANNIITLPSDDILSGADVLLTVEQLYLSGDPVYATYVADIQTIVPAVAMSTLPVIGSSGNSFVNSSFSNIGGNQPVFFNGDFVRFGPTRLRVQVSGTNRPGRIKVTGETLTRLNIKATAGLVVRGNIIDLSGYISGLPDDAFIARVDYAYSEDTGLELDLMGVKLLDSTYSAYGINGAVGRYQFEVGSMPSFTSGEVLNISVLVSNPDDFDELYFPEDSALITDKVFARISRVTVVSGFRSNAGVILGNIVVNAFTQPMIGTSYAVNYSFIAPKEGERLTLRYNMNRLISDVTINVEKVRTVTADVLVKEAFEIAVDVRGEVVINDNALQSRDTILENVTNAVVNLLNTSVLNGTVDYSDIISVAAAIPGVDSVNISLFNNTGELGRRTFIKALDNQYISAGLVTFKAVSRKNFHIT